MIVRGGSLFSFPLSTPSLGITRLSKVCAIPPFRLIFQLPLSGSHHALSRVSIRSREKAAFQLPLSGSLYLPEEIIELIDQPFQLPLSGSRQLTGGGLRSAQFISFQLPLSGSPDRDTL